MYLKTTSYDVKKIMEKIGELDKINKLKFITYILNLWNNNQINSLNEINPDLLDGSIDINIVNPSSIGYPDLVKMLKEYWNHFYQIYRFYPKEYKELMKECNEKLMQAMKNAEKDLQGFNNVMQEIQSKIAGFFTKTEQ